MSSFEEYLSSIGYKPFKVIFEGKKGRSEKKYVPLLENEIGYFSSMIPGRITNHWKKDDIEIGWGLHEAEKPPTLDYPRPKGVFCDDDMNRLLKEHSPKEIYDMLNL